MRPNHKPCPLCGNEMHRQSKTCKACYGAKQGTDEVRRRMSEQRKGKPSYERTEEQRQHLSKIMTGRKMPWIEGKKRPEVGKKISAAWTPEMREAARQRGRLNAENREWLVKIAESMSGEGNPRYRGKGQESPYAPGWGRKYKERIRARANGICERCGQTSDRTLDLHHKDFSKTNHDPDNLLVVCRACHKALHAANSAKT